MTLLTPTPDAIAQAAALLKAGGIVTFPTATLYGLGADARNEAAVQKVFAAKQRPSGKALIVIAASRAALEPEVIFSPQADDLAARFWPGPLTLVLPLRPGHTLVPAVTAGGNTVAVRVESHPVARELLTAFGGLVVAPSANIADAVPPVTPQDVLESLGDAVPLILAAGRTSEGAASTLLDMTGDTPRLLRAGAITAEALEDALGMPLIRQPA